MAKDKAIIPSHAVHADPGVRLIQWVQDKRRQLTVGAVGVAFLGGAVWFVLSAQTRRETFAANELTQARVAVDAGNLQLAASDLGRIVSTYGATPAGQEATIMLARVHIAQNQLDLAASELRTFLQSDPAGQFEAPAAHLLANALEELGEYADAAAAYERAANASPYGLLSADFLMAAGRTETLAADTTRAVAAYRRVLELAEQGTPAHLEARLRLAELQRSYEPPEDTPRG